LAFLSALLKTLGRQLSTSTGLPKLLIKTFLGYPIPNRKPFSRIALRYESKVSVNCGDISTRLDLPLLGGE